MTDDAPPQRRRPLLGISGWLLFVCLFLPTLRVCSTAHAPIEFPPAYGVYVGALAIGLVAFSRSRRARRAVQALVVGLGVATLLTIAVLFLINVAPSTPLLLLSILLGLITTIHLARAAARTAWTGRGIAIGWALHALVASGWNTLLVLDPDHLWGAVVALVASGAMLVDAVIAISSEHAELVRIRDEHALPVARMLRS